MSARVFEHIAVVGLANANTPLFDGTPELQDAGMHDMAGAQAALHRNALTDVCVVFPGRGEHVEILQIELNQ